MTYYIKKPSSLNSSVDVYYTGASQGFARWTDKFDDRKIYKVNPTYLTLKMMMEKMVDGLELLWYRNN